MKLNEKIPESHVYEEDWIDDDLAKSGLNRTTFSIETLTDESQLRERLGFTSISGTRILTVGGYWILCPGLEDYLRLKLKTPILTDNGKVKYLSPKGSGNKAYITPATKKQVENYNPDKRIFITEGEKKAAKATLEGFPCIGIAGVFNFKEKENDFLPELDECNWKDKNVFIVFDSDITEKDGVKLAEHRLAIELSKRGANVFSVRLPEEPNNDKNGIDDFLVRYGAEAFEELIKKAKPTSELHSAPNTKIECEYPSPLDEAAYYGLAGEIVKAIEPHSEADSVALLINLLTAFGNVIECGSWFMVGVERHYPKLFCVIVGDTAKGRKGTSWQPIFKLFEEVEPEWTGDRIQTGLSSGEGLIWHVRDEIYKKDKLVDEGVSDKRLLIIEGEFAQTLKVLSREGNTLSAIIRNAWDSWVLQTITKNSPIKATGTHISIVGHITKSELIRALREIETGNGFANRFLWLSVRRSKCLPFGGDFNQIDLESFTKKLRKAVDFAKYAEEIKWGEDTKTLWAAIYPELSEGKPGIVGAITARAEAQVTRLACIYALLDCSREIKPSHLKAALAVWSYAESSVHYIFQNTMEDPLGNKILDAIAASPLGITRTEINNSLQRNYPTKRIGEALDELRGSRLAEVRSFVTGGRPSERWFLTQQENEKDEINEKRG